MPAPNPKEFTVYVGTYTNGKGEGIYVYRFNAETGELAPRITVSGVPSPAFLAIDEGCRFLYAANELVEFEGEPTGLVSAFAIDPQSHGLSFLNRRVTGGGAPCHLDVDRAGRFVVVANYLGGNVALFPIEPDGTLGEAAQIIRHVGSGPNRNRQEAPHPHSANLDPTDRFVFVPDLGIDRVMAYRLEREQGRLVPNDPPYTTVRPGAGPRHLTFHPTQRFAYLINELDCTITAFEYDADRGALLALQTVPTLPDGFAGENWCADVHVTPSGGFLYGSNRGHDSIVICRVDPASGRLDRLGHQPVEGEFPRNFAIDPTGRYLLAGNRKSDRIVVFRLDEDSGKLEPTGHVVEVPQPACIKMIPAPTGEESLPEGGEVGAKEEQRKKPIPYPETAQEETRVSEAPVAKPPVRIEDRRKAKRTERKAKSRAVGEERRPPRARGILRRKGKEKKKHSVWYYLFKAFEYISLASLIFVYGLLPLLFYFLMVEEARMDVVEYDPQSFKPPYMIETFIGRITGDLEEIGFRPAVHLRSNPEEEPYFPEYLVLYEKREEETGALLFLQDRRDVRANVLNISHLGFSTYYEDETELTVDNVVAPGVFARPKNLTVLHLPGVENPRELYEVHRALVEKLEPSSPRRFYEEGNAAEFMEWTNAFALDCQVETGYFRPPDDAGFYRPTIKGAYFMVWKLLWPGKKFEKRRREKINRMLLEQIGRSDLIEASGEKGKK